MELWTSLFFLHYTFYVPNCGKTPHSYYGKKNKGNVLGPGVPSPDSAAPWLCSDHVTSLSLLSRQNGRVRDVVRPERAGPTSPGSTQSLGHCPSPAPPRTHTQELRDRGTSPHTPAHLLRGQRRPRKDSQTFRPPGPHLASTPMPSSHVHKRTRTPCARAHTRCNLCGVRGESPIALQDKHRK